MPLQPQHLQMKQSFRLETALIVCIPQVEIATELVKSGTKCDIKDNYGRTPVAACPEGSSIVAIIEARGG